MNYLPADWNPSDNELHGKTIMVTGAGDGIGKAAALAFAARGAEVLLLGRTEAKLERVYDQITAAGGVTPGIVPVDFANAQYDDYVALAAELSTAVTCLDGLLHNASILGDRKPLAQASAATWQAVMQVNVNAVFMLTQAMMPLLEASSSASVVLTSSGVGRQGRAFWGAYAVSKFATEGFMQVLADELGNTSKIRVNSLNPGAVNTAMRRNAYPAEPPETNPSPAALMDHWVYLMSDASAGLNGQALSAQ